MNSAFFADASLVLTTAARDFQRAIDQQITSFKKEMELHERAMDELNSRRLSQSWCVEKIDAIKQTLSQLETKEQTKQTHLQTSIEEIELMQKEIDALKVALVGVD